MARARDSGLVFQTETVQLLSSPPRHDHTHDSLFGVEEKTLKSPTFALLHLQRAVTVIPGSSRRYASTTAAMQAMPETRQQSFEEIYGPPENFLEIEV